METTINATCGEIVAMSLGIVLILLHEAYGIGGPDLPAPQAVLMTNVAKGVFAGDLEWAMIYAGAVIGVLIILLDQYQLKRGSDFRVPILAVAIGIYLPIELTFSIFVAVCLIIMLTRFLSKRKR